MAHKPISEMTADEAQEAIDGWNAEINAAGCKQCTKNRLGMSIRAAQEQIDRLTAEESKGTILSGAIVDGGGTASG